MKKRFWILLAVVLVFAGTGISFAANPSGDGPLPAANAEKGTDERPVSVQIISPSMETSGADSLFISVKISHGVYSSYLPTAVRVSVDRVETKTVSGDVTEEILTPVREPVEKDGTNAWYYTERLEKLEPGVYRVTVEAKNAYVKEKGDYFKAAEATVTLTETKEPSEKLLIEPEKKETKEATGLQKILQALLSLFSK